MLSALSAAKKRTQPPLRPTDIRLILVIRDLLISFSSFSSFFREFSELLLGPDGFSARSAIFCRYWTCTFSGSQARLLMPVPLPFSPNLKIYFHLTLNVVAALKISQNKILKFRI